MSLLSAWLPLLALHLSWLGLGLLLLGRVRGVRDWPPLLALPAAYFAGALLAVLALHGVMLTWGPALPTTPAVWALVIAGLAVLPAGLLRWHRAHAAARGATIATIATRSVSRRRLVALLACLLLPPLLLIAVQLVGLPDVSYDSVAFWNAKAAWLFDGARLDTSHGGRFSEVFADARRIHANPDYPLYRPLLAFAQYSVLGSEDDHAAKPGYLFFLCAGLMLLYSLLRDAAGRTTALLALGLLLWTPVMAAATVPGSPGTTYVDFPLGLQFAASLGFLLRALRTRAPADVLAAMIAAASATLMKNEGAVWCSLLVPLGLCALLLGWSRGSAGSHPEDAGARVRPPWLALAWLALPVVVLLAWKALAATFVPQVYIRPPTPGQLARLPEVVPAMAAGWWHSLKQIELWGVTGPFVLLACAVGMMRHVRADRRSLARLALAAVLVGQFCAVLLGVMLLEIQKAGLDNWMAHAWDRLLLQLLPSALLLAVALNTRADTPRAGTDGPRRTVSA